MCKCLCLVLWYQDDDHAAATVTSFDLEKAYQSEAFTTLKFSAGTQNYEIDFKGVFSVLYQMSCLEIAPVKNPCWSALAIIFGSFSLA